MDIDYPGRRPYPVVLANLILSLDRDFHVFTVFQVRCPFHTREVHTDLLADFRLFFSSVHLEYGSPRNEYLYAP